MASTKEAERTLRALSLVSDSREHTLTRDVLILRAVDEGWSYPQIAKAARLTPGRICQIVAAARQDEAPR